MWLGLLEGGPFVHALARVTPQTVNADGHSCAADVAQFTRASLCLVSKGFHAVAHDFLYRELKLLNESSLRSFKRTIREHPEWAHLVVRLDVDLCPFLNRTLGSEIGEDEDEEDWATEILDFEEDSPVRIVAELLETLPNLRFFLWVSHSQRSFRISLLQETTS